MLRRKVAVRSLATVAAAIVLVGLQAPVALATARAQTWNIAQGNNTYYGCGPNGLSDCGTSNDQKLYLTKYLTLLNTPLVVSLQEICSSQAANLMAWGPAHNYYGQYKSTQPNPNHCPSGNTRGNLVLGLGARVEGNIAHEMLPYDGGEHRWVVCQKNQGFPVVYTVCSLHASVAHPTASSQATNAYNWWSTVHSTPWLVGGDFNNDPQGSDSAGVYNWYSSFWEFQHMGTQSTTTGGLKYDYLYSVASFWPDFNSQSCSVTNLSDHYFCLGKMP